MVRARGGFNHAIRAPSTVELFNPQSVGLFAGFDPCAGPTLTFTLAQCVATGLDPSRYGSNTLNNNAQQYNQLAGGNPDLQPEAADTWTLGFVITPIDSLSVALDYYDIKVEGAISGLGAQNVLSACGATLDPAICSFIHRSPTGDLWRSPEGYVSNIAGNFGEIHFKGLDLSANYRWEALGGRMSASLQGTFLLDQEFKPIPGVESSDFDCVGRIDPNCQSPEWRHIASLRYARDWFTVNLRWRYYGELDYESSFTGDPLFTDRLLCDEEERIAAGGVVNGGSNGAPCRGDGGIDAFNYFDISGSAFIGKATEITVGVNNIADKEPPLVGVNEALNANSPGGYDQAGRYFFTSVTFKW
jgi:outer membrane receptor protein involved in Fe transport